MELKLEEYLRLSKKVIGKYACVLLKDENNIGEVARFMMVADERFNGNGSRKAFRVYYAKFGIQTLLRKRKQELSKAQKVSIENRVNDKEIYKDVLTAPVKRTILVNDILRFCPAKYTQLIEDYFVHRMTLREISENHGVSKQDIQQTLKRALSKIRGKISESKLSITDFVDESY